MILIVDSGSTKTDWIALDNNGNELFSTQTLGLNPQMLSNEILNERIKNNFDIYKNRKVVEKLFFYGAGCGVESTQNRILKVFRSIFSKSEFDIKEDTYAAIYATCEPGIKSITSILGTGSNCTYYDGKNILQKVDSLGYVLMDDASGNYFGRQLIRDYYFDKMPLSVQKSISKSFDMQSNTIKDHIYKRPNPNTYLAKFGRFVIDNKELPYFKKLIRKGFSLFISNQIEQFSDCREVPLHFIGSIGFYLKDELAEVLESKKMNIGKVLRKPIDGLVNYHLENI